MNEEQFWNSTIGELKRAFASHRRVHKEKLQETATLHYQLADLIGRSISRIYNSSNTMPDISEIYPTLFDSELIKQKRQEKQAELSAARFKQFAESFNQNFNKEGKQIE